MSLRRLSLPVLLLALMLALPSMARDRLVLGTQLEPPGLDSAIAVALRQGFAKAMHDPDLIAEAAKIDLELNFVSGEEVQAMVERLYRLPPDVLRRAQAIAAAN